MARIKVLVSESCLVYEPVVSSITVNGIMGFTMARFWVVLALADQPVTKISFRLALKNWLPLLNVWPIIFLIAGSFTWLMAWLAMGLNLD